MLVPVNLRPLFGSETLRNFALYVTPGVDPKLGNWDFQEICRSVHFQMGAQITPKEMASRLTTNVRSEKSPILKIMPLFIKNIAMKAVYNAVGERKSCINLSNLGVIGQFIGMLTDSRSFLSYTRHEYFRRILCRFFGRLVSEGEYPKDMSFLGSVVEDICYNNCLRYFDFKPAK